MPLYSGFLCGEGSERPASELIRELEHLGLEHSNNDFYCTAKLRKMPVCCNGPTNSLGNFERCDKCHGDPMEKSKIRENVFGCHDVFKCPVLDSIFNQQLYTFHEV